MPKISFSKVWGNRGNIESDAHEKSFIDPNEVGMTINDGTVVSDLVFGKNSVTHVVGSLLDGKAGKVTRVTIKDGGKLYIYQGGVSEDNIIVNRGREVVAALNGVQGLSKNATVEEGGEQIVEDGGRVENSTIISGAQFVYGKNIVGNKMQASLALNTTISGKNQNKGKQEVYDGGVAQNTVVKQDGIQYVQKKDQSVEEGGSVFNTIVFKGGEQHVLAGGQATQTTLKETAIQKVYAGGYVKTLTINDEAESLVFSGATLGGVTMVQDSGKLRLYVGDDQHNSKIEEVVLKGKDAKLYSIASEGNGKKTLIQKLSGEGNVIFAFTGSDPYYSQLHVNDLSGSLHFEFNTDIAGGLGDYLLVDKGEGHHTISVSDSGAEITNRFSGVHDLITDKSGGASFTLENFSNNEVKAIDGGAYMYSLKHRKDENKQVWFLSAKYDDDSEGPDPAEPMNPDKLLTTPSTDAVLSTSVASGLIFNNELQTVRLGRGIFDKNRKDDATFWGYTITNRERVATGHTNFKLDQTGIILGSDQLHELTYGDLYIGGLGSYDHARIAHARGGDSYIDIYSIGAYATYFDEDGWYLDGVLKYSYYHNNLKAISTNGLAVQGNYNQWAIGGSFEMGGRFKTEKNTLVQPYVRLTGARVEDKKVNLLNGMTGDISPFMSLQSEVGVFVGHEFIGSPKIPLTAYITGAWVHENMNNNNTVINKQHKFITDLSGSAGKVGIGFKSVVNDNLSLYMEADYLKGSKIKKLLQGRLGMRYNF
ncbi:BafA family autotransporter [Bartonella sp. B30(2025)]